MATNNAINQIGVLPAFMATSNADQSNVTGDGTIYDIQFPDEIFDVTNSFDAVSTFTAPLSGKYFFNVQLLLSDVSAAMTNDLIYITTTAATYRLVQQSFAADISVGGVYVFNSSTIANMSVGDTAKVTIRFLNGAKALDIKGATAAAFRTPVFSGYMISGI